MKIYLEQDPLGGWDYRRAIIHTGYLNLKDHRNAFNRLGIPILLNELYFPGQRIKPRYYHQVDRSKILDVQEIWYQRECSNLAKRFATILDDTIPLPSYVNYNQLVHSIHVHATTLFRFARWDEIDALQGRPQGPTIIGSGLHGK